MPAINKEVEVLQIGVAIHFFSGIH